MSDKIKVLIIDDSAVIRNVISDLLNNSSYFEVIATASNPFVAAKKIAIQVPDVIILDIEMPKMDGLTFLQRIMAQHPLPVMVFSSLTERGSITAMKALEYGAVEVFNKPTLGNRGLTEKEFKIQFVDVLRAVAGVKVRRKATSTRTSTSKEQHSQRVAPKYSADKILSYSEKRAMVKTTERIIAIGASTGGTEAIRHVLEPLPHDVSGIVIVQHMPELFTKSFADRLNQLCKITVQEAKDGDSVIRGRALIAPGNKHMMLKRAGARYYVEIKDGDLVNRHRPSVDVLFRSVAMYAGSNAAGILLTGMGDDGAQGLLEIKNSGGMTIAQDERTSVVFGMPAEAIKRGAAQKVQPLHSIAGLIERGL